MDLSLEAVWSSSPDRENCSARHDFLCSKNDSNSLFCFSVEMECLKVRQHKESVCTPMSFATYEQYCNFVLDRERTET